jgi:hypothetical protein
LLIQPDINELGDLRLDPKEGVAQKREECLSMAAKKRLYKQEELEDPTRALGPRLQFSEVVSKLRRIVPTIKVLDGSPGSVALYTPRTHQEIKDAMRGWQNDRDYFFLKYKYVGGFPKCELQEYSTVDIDNAMLPTKENRGWRSVLIPLIQQGLVSYRTVVNEFGDVGTDRRGWRWNEQTQKWRNNPEVAFTN